MIVEITFSSILRWIIRLGLIYAIVRLFKSQRMDEGEEDEPPGRKKEPGRAYPQEQQESYPSGQNTGIRQRGGKNNEKITSSPSGFNPNAPEFQQRNQNQYNRNPYAPPGFDPNQGPSIYAPKDRRDNRNNKANDGNFDDIISKLSKPQKNWEANQKSVVEIMGTQAKSNSVIDAKPKNVARLKKEKEKEILQVLRHHTRPVTWVCFNKEGNLLYSCGKDAFVVVWKLIEEQWQILAVYTGHTGAVWCCDISRDSQLLVSCGADNKVIVWNAQAMSLAATRELRGVAKFCEWRPNRIKDSAPTFAVCHNSFGKSTPPAIVVCEFHTDEIRTLYSIGPETNCLQVRWTKDELLVSAHENGKVIFWRMAERLFEIDCGAKLTKICIHEDTVVCSLLNCFIKVYVFTDGGAKVLCEKETDRPLNAVDFDGDNLFVGGGQDARDVALQNINVEKQFTPLMFRGTADGLQSIYDGRFKNHFGPIHCVSFTSQFVASGSEDGLVHMELIEDKKQ